MRECKTERFRLKLTQPLFQLNGVAFPGMKIPRNGSLDDHNSTEDDDEEEIDDDEDGTLQSSETTEETPSPN